MKKKRPKKKKRYVIYVATNKVNGKQYVGQSCDFKERKKIHHRTAKKPPNKKQYPLHKAIKKYGANAFDWQVIESNLSLKEANAREEYYISKYDTLVPHGYNLRKGGYNKEFHPTSIQKMKKNAGRGDNNSRVKNPPNEEERRQISARMRGDNHPCKKITSEQVIAIYSDALFHGMKPKDLYQKYGHLVSRHHLSWIIHKRTWKSILEPLPDIDFRKPIKPPKEKKPRGKFKLTSEEQKQFVLDFQGGMRKCDLGIKYQISQPTVRGYVNRLICHQQEPPS